MNYKYLAVYKINGITPPEDRAERILLEFPALHGRVLLSYDPVSYLCELDKMALIGHNMLSGKLNPTDNQTYEELLERALQKIQEKRKKEFERGVFLVFEALGESEDYIPSHTREMRDFIISLENEDQKKKISEKYQAIINGIISSFAISTEQIHSFVKVKEGTVFIHENGKYLYSFTCEMHGSASVSTRLTSETCSFVRKHGKYFGKHQNLISPARLLAKSLDKEIDDIQSFLSAWSGLEIFVNKNFNNFESITFDKLTNHETALAPSKFLNRIKSVMQGKYRLVDKFSVISFELSPDSSQNDIANFEEIKDVRDKFMHGNDMKISNLPTTKTTILLRKYLKLYTEWAKA